MKPLEGLLVLDFSTLLPGPLASLMLAEAGASVVKVEHPSGGDAMRGYDPKLDGEGLNFAMLNRGKRSLALDLKNPDALKRLTPVLERTDILIEQFRPGVMERLGLGYEAVKAIKPDIIYCSVTGYGQSGAKAFKAGHDLNYMAETGVLSLSQSSAGDPILPPTLVADIAGGTYPALVNVLLALLARNRTGEGAHIDVSMADNLFPFLYWALPTGFAHSQWPRPGGELVTGGSPRYQIYRTLDNRHIAAAPLEDKFWFEFCALIGLPEQFRMSDADAEIVRGEVANLIAMRTAAEWEGIFASHDVCCSVVATLAEGVADPHIAQRGVFSHRLDVNGHILPALPMPVASIFRKAEQPLRAPELGEYDRPPFA